MENSVCKIHSIFFMYLSKIYTIYPFHYSSNAFEIGQDSKKTLDHGGQQIIDHYFFNVRNIWKTGPDSCTFTCLLSNKMCSYFQVGIYHEKFQLDQIQIGRPTATFDFNMRNNRKTVPDS